MLRRITQFAVLSLIALVSVGSAGGSPGGDPHVPAAEGLVTRVVATGLYHPWELVWGSDNWIWFTERRGHIGRLNPETGEVQRLLTIGDVWAENESGLLGMALHPRFPFTPHLFVSYTSKDLARKERIVRYTFNGTTLVEPLTLLDGLMASDIHNGSRLLIVDDKLFITTGDADNLNSPQNLNSNNGKILRINLDGSIPDGNPFGTAVWSFGHRNAQGLVMAGNGILYSSEHGPDSDDEVNVIEKGHNYGWPRVSGFCDLPSEESFCETNSVIEPIAAWTPTLAVSGMTYYNEDLIPQWKHCLLMLTLKERQLMVLKLSEDGRSVVSQEKVFDNEFGRLRAICVAPDGRVFFSTDAPAGRVIEVMASPASRKPLANEMSTLQLDVVGKLLHITAPQSMIDGSLEINDAAGRIVHIARLSTAATKLDLNTLASGVYTVRLLSKGESLTGRFHFR